MFISHAPIHLSTTLQACTEKKKIYYTQNVEMKICLTWWHFIKLVTMHREWNLSISKLHKHKRLSSSLIVHTHTHTPNVGKLHLNVQKNRKRAGIDMMVKMICACRLQHFQFLLSGSLTNTLPVFPHHFHTIFDIWNLILDCEYLIV